MLDDNRLNHIKRLKIENNTERKSYQKLELEKITDKLMKNLSGQKGYKIESKKHVSSVCEATYTQMCGEYATPEQIIVIVNQYGDLYEYKRLSEFYGDFSIIDKKTVDFLRVEENTKDKVKSDKNLVVDNFIFSNKHLFFLADGTLCVGYNYQYEKTENNEVITQNRKAYTIIGKLDGGVKYRESNNMLGLSAGDLYYVDSSHPTTLNSGRNIPEGTWNGDLSFNYFSNFAKESKLIDIDEKEIELIYETTGKFFDPSVNKLITYDYYHFNSLKRTLPFAFKQNSDEICFFNWVYNEENSSEQDKRKKAEELINKNFQVDGFNCEYDSVTNTLTYTKMIGKFYTNTYVYARLYSEAKFTISSRLIDVPNIKEPQIDIDDLNKRIIKSLNDRLSDELLDVDIEKIIISRFFETILIDIEVVYKTSTNQPDGSQIKFKYILGEVENK